MDMLGDANAFFCFDTHFTYNTYTIVHSNFKFNAFDLGNESISQLLKLKQQLQNLTSNSPTLSQLDTANDNGNLSQRDNIKKEIEGILAAECLFCGELMIKHIDKPFIEDWDRVTQDWQ